MVALTFDDGPFEGPTDALLAALRSTGTTASFFVVGERAAAAPHLVARALEDGHAVGPHCHTSSHPSHHQLTESLIRADLEQVLDTLSSLGAPRPRFWRPPYGDFRDPETYRIAAEHDLTLVGWTVETCDWQDRGADEMLSDLRRADRRDGALREDSVILMHDKPATAELVPRLVDELRGRGYSTGALRPGNAAVVSAGERRYGRLDGQAPCQEPGN